MEKKSVVQVEEKEAAASHGLGYSSLLGASTSYSGGVLAAESGSEVERVKQGILDMIRDRQIVPGQRLDQRRLAKFLESTTAPLREALSSLEAEGLLVRERGLGVFCRFYTVREIEEMIEIRGVLEGLAARWAVANITPENLAELSELAAKLEQSFEPSDEAKFVETHLHFHKLVLQLSRSSALRTLMTRHYFIDAVLRNVSPKLWQVEPHDHHTVVQALASGDPEKAEAAMRAHIAPTFKERLERLRKQYGNGPILPALVSH